MRVNTKTHRAPRLRKTPFWAKVILSMEEPIEEFWSEILSREPDRIRTAFEAISTIEKKAVLDHLKRMVTEDGWHPEQFVSASLALDALEQKG